MTRFRTIRRPDDWHVHFRDGAMLRDTVAHTARQFARAIVMPNILPPVTTAEQARAYRERILAVLPHGSDFEPLMTAYLTDDSDGTEIAQGHSEGIFTAAKLYPANATTGSARGVTDIRRVMPVLERMAAMCMPLLVHGEVVNSAVDIFDREAVFIDRVLTPLVRALPELKIVLEHITTKEAVDFVTSGPATVAATITPHHLHINRNAMFAGGFRPHAYCLPVAKRERHRLALRSAATSGSSKFFLGTDSAPHFREAKESPCGHAGIFNAPYALESYISVFDSENALDHFEAFASESGPRFYGLRLNEGTLTLERSVAEVPEHVVIDGQEVIPFHAAEVLGWQLAAN